MQIRLFCGLQNVVKRLPWGEKHGYRHSKHLCDLLAWKDRAFLRLVALNMLIYVNLCKSMQIRWVCEILKSTKTKSTECQPGWKHKNDIFKKCVETSKPVSKWLLHFWTKTRFCVEMALCRNCLCRSDWHPVTYMYLNITVSSLIIWSTILRLIPLTPYQSCKISFN